MTVFECVTSVFLVINLVVGLTCRRMLSKVLQELSERAERNGSESYTPTDFQSDTNIQKDLTNRLLQLQQEKYSRIGTYRRM